MMIESRQIIEDIKLINRSRMQVLLAKYNNAHRALLSSNGYEPVDDYIMSSDPHILAQVKFGRIFATLRKR